MFEAKIGKQSSKKKEPWFSIIASKWQSEVKVSLRSEKTCLKFLLVFVSNLKFAFFLQAKRTFVGHPTVPTYTFVGHPTVPTYTFTIT